jgi:hypothetical protein
MSFATWWYFCVVRIKTNTDIFIVEYILNIVFIALIDFICFFKTDFSLKSFGYNFAGG